MSSSLFSNLATPSFPKYGIGQTSTPSMPGQNAGFIKSAYSPLAGPGSTNSFTPPATPTLSGFSSTGKAIPGTPTGSIKGLANTSSTTTTPSTFSNQGPGYANPSSIGATPVTSPMSLGAAENSSYAAPQNQAGSQTGPFMQNINTQSNYAGGQGNPAVNTAQGTLQGIASNGSPAVNSAINNLSQFQQGGGKLLNEIQTDPGLAASVSSGIASGVGQQLGTTEQALATQAQNALTQQGQQVTAAGNAGQTAQNQQTAQIGAANNAATLTQKSQAAYGQTIFDPATGTYSNPGGGAGLDPQAMASQLAQKVNSGQMSLSDAQTIMGYAGGAGAGFLQNAIQQINPNFNPTAQSASMTQNASQSTQYQQLSTDLGANIAVISKNAQPLISALTSAGLGTSGNETINELMKSGLSQSNPGAVTAINGYVQEVNTAIQNMVSRGNITPTEVGLQSGDLNISDLPVSQIPTVLSDLQQAGQITQGVYQNIAKSSGSTNAYMGGNVNPGNASTPVQPQNVLPSNSSGYTNTGIGVSADVGSWFLNTVQSLGPEVLSYLGGKASK